MISSVPRRCWEIARERISSSVITPPALRITCASPIEIPRIGYGFRRASIQATTATFLAGGRGRSPLSNPSAKALLFSRNSSIALNLGLLSDRVASFRVKQLKRIGLIGFTRTSATDGENEAPPTPASLRLLVAL